MNKQKNYLLFGLKIQTIIPIKAIIPTTIITGKTQRGHCFSLALSLKL